MGIILSYTFKRFQQLLISNLQRAIDEQHQELKQRKRIEQELEQKNAQLEHLSQVDGLTGVINRRHFDDLLTKEYLRHSRNKQPLSLLLIDVDYFKKYNDNYGHIMGDKCLINIANLIASSVNRPVDTVARYGGEEFICILPETDMAGAIVVANKMMQHIRDSNIPHEVVKERQVTVSIGAVCSEAHPTHTEHQLINQADKMLYLAKKLGRNRVEHV